MSKQSKEAPWMASGDKEGPLYRDPSTEGEYWKGRRRKRPHPDEKPKRGDDVPEEVKRALGPLQELGKLK